MELAYLTTPIISVQAPLDAGRMHYWVLEGEGFDVAVVITPAKG